MKSKNNLDLARENLESHGLTTKDAELLGIEVLTSEETKSVHFGAHAVPSLKLNYFDIDKTPLADWPKCPPYYRLRYLETPANNTFSAAMEKPLRYVQPPMTVPVAYYPKNENWLEIVDNVNIPIIITEGEFKAAKACKEGFPTIGLGGVYSWKSKIIESNWVPSLDLVNWKRRIVYIAFDSDYKSNNNVVIALRQLSEALQEQGAIPSIISLPNIEGLDKVGLDDLLTFGGSDSAKELNKLILMSHSLTAAKKLWTFNDNYMCVEDPPVIININTFSKSEPSKFKTFLKASDKLHEKTINSDGNVILKEVSMSEKWVQWPLRAEASTLTYAPGKEKLVPHAMSNQSPMFNIWSGWGVEPVKGSVKLFLKIIDYLFASETKEAKEWFLSWCAYPLQNPGAKLASAAVFHGVNQGTGKTLIGKTLGKIYGKNYTEISQRDLHADFNAWAEGKQFVMGDDVTGSDKRQDADYLKKLITQQELRINAKYMPEYVIPDCVNYFFTSNHPDAFYLEDTDRRFFIVDVQSNPLDKKFYKEYIDWLDSGGVANIFDWFLSYKISPLFGPFDQAYKTTAKDQMIVTGQSDLATWVRELIDNPDFILRVGNIKLKKDMYTSKELLNIYDADAKTKLTANGLSRELKRARVYQVNGGSPIKLTDGSQGRYYVIRNVDKWSKAKLSDVVKHLSSK